MTKVLALLVVFLGVVGLAFSQEEQQEITLNEYLDIVQADHPFFSKEQLAVAIERKQAESLLGDRDWFLSAVPAYSYLGKASAPETAGETVEQINRAGLEAGLDKRLWSTGGRLGFSWTSGYSRADTDFGLSNVYRNGVGVTYTQPFLQNWKGKLDRLQYELSDYTIDSTQLEVWENQENFLLEVSLGFLDWAYYNRELLIREERLRIAQEALEQVNKRFSANLVDKVDVLRAEDSVRLAEQAVISDVLMARQIAGSGLSKLLYRGASKVHGVTTFSDALITARELLAGEAPRFVTLYWGSLDGVGHVYGPFSERFTAELRALDAILRQQLEGNLLDATLLVAADHGMVEMADRDYLTLEDLPPLGGALRLPPVGEPRATYAFLDRGRVEEVREALCAREDLEFAVLRSEEALALGLFGDGAPHPEAAARLGDLVLVSTGRRGLYHAYPDAARLRGMHGGLTDHEMLVPLLIAAI
jgi:hypothetical protein